MPRTRKSGAGQPPANTDPPNTDEGDAATMAHISADELAGSPDILAAKRPSSSGPLDMTTPEDDATTTAEEAPSADLAESKAEPPPAAVDPVITPLAPPAVSVEPPP